MRTCGGGRPARSKHFGPKRAGMALATAVSLAAATGGCGTAINGDVGAAGRTLAEAATPVAALTVDWSNPIAAKILMADFSLAAPPTNFVVGQSYRLEIRNVTATQKSFVAPGFFHAIAVRNLVVSTGKPRLEQAGFEADVMEALAYRTAEVIAAMLPPGFELVEEPDDSFVLNLTPEQEAALAQPVAPAGDLPANPFALEGGVGGPLPDDPFALGEAAPDKLPADPFALAEPVLDELPANPFALAGEIADVPAADIPEADLGDEILALVEEPAEVDAAVPEAPPAPEPEAPMIEPQVAPAVPPANLEEVVAENVIVEDAEPLQAAADPAAMPDLNDADELALLAEWTTQAAAFAAPEGLYLPPNSSVFLTFVPLRAGTYEVEDDARIAGIGAKGTVTFVNPGTLARLPEAARPAADLALLIAEARDGQTIDPHGPNEPAEIVDEPIAPAPEPPFEPMPEPDPHPGADDPGPPDDI